MKSKSINIPGVGHLPGKIGLLVILLIVVCVAVMVTHWPGLSAEAISFDDSQYLTENKLVQNPSWASVRRFFSEVLEPSTVTGYYQPLTMVSLMVDYAIGGRSDYLLPFHRTSLALHMMNTILVIVLLFLLFGRVWAAGGAGLLFGVHPMTVELICWISDRKDLLAFFFVLWTLIFYVRFVQSGNRKLYSICILMYLLALLCKPTATPLPALMLLIDYWPLRRLKWRTVLEKVPFFTLAVIASVITYISQSRMAYATPPSVPSMARIIMVLCHNIIFYLYKIFWPVNLVSFYPYPEPMALSEAMVLAGVIGTCVLIGLLVLCLRWTRSLLIGWLLFFTAIFPTMGVVGFTHIIAADRYVYLPSIGLLMILTSFLNRFCGGGGVGKGHKIQRAVIAAFLIAITVGEGIATRRYLVYWRDTETLCRRMLTLNPDYAQVRALLGNALKSQGKLDKAAAQYRRALEIKPDYALAYYNLGLTLRLQGELDKAIEQYRIVLEIEPNHVEARTNLGNVLQLQGRLDEAISEYRQVLQIKPEFVKAHYNLGMALDSQGDFKEAIGHYRRALQGEADDAEAHFKLALALTRTNRLDEAVEHYLESVRLKPNWPQSLTYSALILATHPNPKLRDVNQAIRFAKRASDLTKNQDPVILYTLAKVYATAGQLELAIKTAEDALSLAFASEDNNLADLIEEQLELYRQARLK